MAAGRQDDRTFARRGLLRIGVDVGGTNTDAVLMDGLTVRGEVKTPTTDDVTTGIVTALRRLLEETRLHSSRIRAVMIGTTHFTNAVVEARRLTPTAAVRLGLPATRALPPMTDWPERLLSATGGQVYLCHGGHEFDGKEIAPLDPSELRRVAADIGAKNIGSVAICSVFSPVNAVFEEEAACILEAELPGVAISLSHTIGRLGLLERENATILNACLRDLAVHIVAAFRSALSELEIQAPLYFSQNDGTLMSAEHAERYPVKTFASGPTNSMRGAAFLSGIEDCAVVDIGGTTSDIGVLEHGFPREASVAVMVGGVRTNFRMPDVLSIGIGGGSIVHQQEGLAIGPDSVGFRLTELGRVFGGDTLTSTDLAVAHGRVSIGDPDRVAKLDRDVVRAGLELIETTIASAIDRMKTHAEAIPVVVVGGGSILLPDALPGASQLVKPDHFAVANAIGAAISQVGGEIERTVSLERTRRDTALDEAKQDAMEMAVAAGANPGSIRIVDIEEIPLAYLPGNATRVRVRAVGDLATQGQ